MSQESLHSKQLVKNKSKAQSTQQFLDIEQIKDGTVILKNGSLRAVLMVSSINFDLKSSEEQDAIITYYQNFLNSLDFPIQIFISSRKVNLGDYIAQLEARSKEQINELLQLQMEDYIKFISSLGNMTDIVNKNFYIVIPFSPVENKKSTLKEKFYEIFTPKKTMVEQEKKSFEIYKDQLYQRVEYIQYGLNGIGVRMVPLSTQELIELYYSLYNPTSIERLGMAPLEEMAVKTSLYN
ncbi:MAG: hypothetical protein GF347_02260 [Candidatus Moranbacteria bacterium]|nr:hypothetical protein [Candidatus Moranbacteria bacterium]